MKRFVVIRRNPDGTSRVLSCELLDLFAALNTRRAMSRLCPSHRFEVALAKRRDRQAVSALHGAPSLQQGFAKFWKHLFLKKGK